MLYDPAAHPRRLTEVIGFTFGKEFRLGPIAHINRHQFRQIRNLEAKPPRGGPERRLGPHPRVLAGADARRPGGAPRPPEPGGDALAVYSRRARRDRRLAGRLFARRLLPGAAG